VLENADALAFLDHRPLFPGHCLLIPKSHCPDLADLPAALVGPLFDSARLLSQAVEEAMQAEGTFLAINNKVSQSVPHLHIHVVPRRKGDGLRGFFWPRRRYSNAEAMQQAQEAIRAAVERITGSRQGPAA
jgi:histidine triad (HIT) family protein